MATTHHYTVKIFIYEIEPQIWRKFSIPADFTFAQLHQTIQKVMGWQNLQDHEFLHGKGKKLDQVIAADDHDHAGASFYQNEENVVVGDFVGRKKLPLRLLYRYDFMEDWIHEIVIESKNENTTPKAVAIEGARACPPEDSGGPWEYKSCIEGESRWMDDDYDPEKFDITKIKL